MKCTCIKKYVSVSGYIFEENVEYDYIFDNITFNFLLNDNYIVSLNDVKKIRLIKENFNLYFKL